MRVLFVTPSPPSPAAHTAVPIVAWAQLEAMRQRHEITLLTTAGPDYTEWNAVEQLRDSGLDVRAQRRTDGGARDRIARWIRNAGRWLTTDRPMYTLWYYEPELQRTIDTLLARERFDIIHVNDTAMACYNFATDAPKLLVENEVRTPRPVNLSGLLRGHLYRGVMDEADWHRWPAYQRRTWRNFDCVEVFTTRDARIARQIAPDIAARVNVNPFGMQVPEAADPAREEDGSVVFIGNFTHAPNVDAAHWLAREVMPLLRARYAGARLHICGSDPRGALRGIACDDIEMHGWVKSLEAVIETAAVVVAPVRIGGGQRMKVLQAMAMGKAVVTTPRGADGLLDGDAAEPPVACGTAAVEIADLTAQLLRDRERRHALGARARALVMEQHDVRAYGKRIDATYASLVERSHVLQPVGA